MRHTDRKKEKDKLAASIMLCFCLIALTSIFTIKASIDKISKNAGDLPVTQETTTIPAEDEVEETIQSKEEPSPAKDTEEDAVMAEIPTTEIQTIDSLESPQGSPDYLCPVDMSIASVTNPYSMDMVIYNATLDQYMTHPGIDLEGPMNSGVKAIADGTITDIYHDDAYGITIEITHTNGLVSKYANLDTDEYVEKGDTVTKGQHISNIGQSALYESMEKCHLHFELYEHGEMVDPTDYIDFDA